MAPPGPKIKAKLWVWSIKWTVNNASTAFNYLTSTAVTQDNLKYVQKGCMGMQGSGRCWLFAWETEVLALFHRQRFHPRCALGSLGSALGLGCDLTSMPRRCGASLLAELVGLFYLMLYLGACSLGDCVPPSPFVLGGDRPSLQCKFRPMPRAALAFQERDVPFGIVSFTLSSEIWPQVLQNGRREHAIAQGWDISGSTRVLSHLEALGRSSASWPRAQPGPGSLPLH